MNLKVDKSARIAFALHIFAVASIIICRCYIDLLFLSTYPRQWLPHLFMGQTVITFVLALGLTPLISKGSRSVNFSFLVCAAGVVLALQWTVLQSNQAVPFILCLCVLCLWLAALSMLLGAISWNSVNDAFNIREFKRLAKWVGAAGSVGALLIGLSIPVIVNFFSAENLLPILALLIIISAGFVYALGVKGSSLPKQASQQNVSPARYPLFRYLAAAFVVMILIDTLADYTLKGQLAIVYDKNAIATFMGPFYGLASGITLWVQFFVTDQLLHRFGFAGPLGVVPIFCFVGSLGIIIAVGLWTAAIFRFAENVSYYGLYNVGGEIAGIPLPSPVRRAGKLFLKGIIQPAGMGISALSLWTAAESIGTRGLAIRVATTCIVWVYLIRKMTGAYQRTLEDAVRTRRLGIAAAEPDESGPLASRDAARHALNSKEPEIVLFGLGLLERPGVSLTRPRRSSRAGEPAYSN